MYYVTGIPKGFVGEAMVNMATRLFLNKNNYHLIMCLRSEQGLQGNGVFQRTQ
jgi:hypothetical protein